MKTSVRNKKLQWWIFGILCTVMGGFLSFRLEGTKSRFACVCMYAYLQTDRIPKLNPVCVYVYTYMHAYICIYTYIHIDTWTWVEFCFMFPFINFSQKQMRQRISTCSQRTWYTLAEAYAYTYSSRTRTRTHARTHRCTDAQMHRCTRYWARVYHRRTNVKNQSVFSCTSHTRDITHAQLTGTVMSMACFLSFGGVVNTPIWGNCKTPRTSRTSVFVPSKCTQ